MNIRLANSFPAWSWVAILLLDCSKSGTIAVSPATDTRPMTGTCDRRMLPIEDLAGILASPLVDRTSLAGDALTCQFLTGGFAAITVRVRPNVGRAAVDAWNAGKMPLTATPLPGVGDQALWQGSLHEVISQKNDLLCDIAIRGGEGDIALPAEDLPGVLGALCNEVFAAFG